MKKFVFLFKGRNIILAVMLIFAVICGVMSQRVNVITDMTKFLPDNSSMKKGVDIMYEELDGLSAGGTIRLMSA